MRKNIFILLAMTAILYSCSSPESDGKKAAKALNKCQEDYFNERRDAYVDLIDNFDSFNFETRVAVREKMREISDRAEERRDKAQKEAEENYQRCERKYVVKYKDYVAFEQAFNASLQGGKDYDSELEPLYRQINRKILSIIPGRPDVDKIRQTLVGRIINDQKDGYFGRSWNWKIEEGEVKSLSILDEEKNGDGYRYDVDMTLQADGGAYCVKATLYYVLREYDDWVIEMLESKEVNVVRTGRYDSCIKIEEGVGWGHALLVYNNSDAALLVGGAYLKYGRWCKFSRVVKGNDYVTVDYYPDDYKIHFVERP